MIRKTLFILLFSSYCALGFCTSYGASYTPSYDTVGNSAYRNASGASTGLNTQRNQTGYAYATSSTAGSYALSTTAHSLPSMTHRSCLSGQFTTCDVQTANTDNGHHGANPRRVSGDSNPPDIMWQPLGEVPFLLLLLLCTLWTIRRRKVDN